MSLSVGIQAVTVYSQAEAALTCGGLAGALSPAITNLAANVVTCGGELLAQALLVLGYGFFGQSGWLGTGA